MKNNVANQNCSHLTKIWKWQATRLHLRRTFHHDIHISVLSKGNIKGMEVAMKVKNIVQDFGHGSRPGSWSWNPSQCFPILQRTIYHEYNKFFETISLPITLLSVKIILIQMSYICQIAQIDISSTRILSSNNIDQLSLGGPSRHPAPPLAPFQLSWRAIIASMNPLCHLINLNKKLEATALFQAT